MASVSVIIPAFNGASRYLDEAIQSVLSQTCTDIELIVADDASEDETAFIVSQFRQVVYHRLVDHQGQAAARNHGARLASSEFLAFLDQDDLWEPTFLEETLGILRGNPASALVHTDGYQVNERNEIIYYDAAMKHSFTISQILRDGHDTGTSGTLLRKKCFDEIGGYDERQRIWEDRDLGIRLYQQFSFVHLPRPLYRHRLFTRNVGKLIPKDIDLGAREYFLRKHSSLCHPGTPAGRALGQDWARYYSDKGKHDLERGSTHEARSALRSSLRYDPLSRRTILRLLRAYLPKWARFLSR